jgi:hypothetical protein
LQIPKKKFRVKELIPYHKFSFGVLSLLPFAAATIHDAIPARQQDEEGFHFGCIYYKKYKTECVDYKARNIMLAAT